MAGYRYDYGTPRYWWSAARYSEDGVLDTSFAGDGIANILPTSGASYARSVAVHSDGKVVLAGSGDGDFKVARLTAAGVLDASFDIDGIATTDFGSDYDAAYSVAVQANGKIVVAGYARSATTSYDFAIARYNIDGSPDTGFSDDGRVTSDFSGKADFARAVALQSDGNIVAVGYSYNSLSAYYHRYDFALARYSMNSPPVADAGGDYDVAEGGAVSLDASGSDDPDLPKEMLTYEWDLDLDGEYDDATGEHPTISAALLDGPLSVTVGLKVTDDHGEFDTDTATINVVNVPPTVDAGSDLVGVVTDPIGFSATVIDPCPTDTHTYLWDFGDGNTSSQPAPTHVYDLPGAYEVSVTVTDDDLDPGSDSLEVTVSKELKL